MDTSTPGVNTMLVRRKRRKLDALPRRSNFIAEWRELRGLTQEELGALIGRAPGTVSRIETGNHAYTQQTLESIARELHCSPADLLRKPQDPAREAWLALGEKVSTDRSGRILRAVKALVGEDEAAE